jgi:hypothetical protein
MTNIEGVSLPKQPEPELAEQEFLHVECDCVPNDGPSHCHLCTLLSNVGGVVEWPCGYAEAQAAWLLSVQRAAREELASQIEAIHVPYTQWEFPRVAGGQHWSHEKCKRCGEGYPCATLDLVRTLPLVPSTQPEQEQ